MTSKTATRGKCLRLVRANVASVKAHGTAETGRGMGWRALHAREWRRGHPIALMVEALARMADASLDENGREIGTDGYCAEPWMAIASNVVHLLSADIGTLDGGTVDGLIRELALSAGFSADEADRLESL